MWYVLVVLGLIISGGFTTGVAYFKGYNHAAEVYNAESVRKQLEYERGLSSKYLAGQKEAEKIALEANQNRERVQREFEELNDIVKKISDLEQKVQCVDEVIVTRLRNIK